MAYNVVGLSGEDELTFCTLMDMFGPKSGASWIRTRSWEADVIILGKNAEEPSSEEMLARADRFQRIIHAGRGPEFDLPLPIEFETFSELLSSLARSFLELAASPGTDVSSKSPGSSSAEHPVEPEILVATDVPQIETPRPDPVIGLKRWPPETMLEGHPDFLRLAALLSRKPIPASRLAQLCNVDSDTCIDFIVTGVRHGVVEVFDQAVQAR